MPGRYENTRRVPVEAFFAFNEVSNVIHRYSKVQRVLSDCGGTMSAKIASLKTILDSICAARPSVIGAAKSIANPIRFSNTWLN